MLGVGPSSTLSQLLKEAKSEVAPQAVEGGDSDSARLPLSYSRLFDEYHGVCWGGRNTIMVSILCCRCGASGGLGAAL